MGTGYRGQLWYTLASLSSHLLLLSHNLEHLIGVLNTVRFGFFFPQDAQTHDFHETGPEELAEQLMAPEGINAGICKNIYASLIIHHQVHTS